MHRYVKVSELIVQVPVDDAFLRLLDQEELIHLKQTLEGEPVVSAEDAERVRIIRLLTMDLDVNMAGVEVILHMRETMVAMQRQFADVLDSLVKELRQRSGSR
jgi:MerR family transcriptional regulator/heat shock protein HspR